MDGRHIVIVSIDAVSCNVYQLLIVMRESPRYFQMSFPNYNSPVSLTLGFSKYPHSIVNDYYMLWFPHTFISATKIWNETCLWFHRWIKNNEMIVYLNCERCDELITQGNSVILTIVLSTLQTGYSADFPNHCR